MSVLHLLVVMFHFLKLISIYIKLHTVKGTEKRAVENKINIYNDYQSAGLIPPAVIIEKQKYLTYIVD